MSLDFVEAKSVAGLMRSKAMRAKQSRRIQRAELLLYRALDALYWPEHSSLENDIRDFLNGRPGRIGRKK